VFGVFLLQIAESLLLEVVCSLFLSSLPPVHHWLKFNQPTEFEVVHLTVIKDLLCFIFLHASGPSEAHLRFPYFSISSNLFCGSSGWRVQEISNS
jgi:hypothetical protein